MPLIRMLSSQHCQDDELERYLMGHTQDEAELARVEEHLLACVECVERTEAIVDFSAAMKEALRQIAESGPDDSDA